MNYRTDLALEARNLGDKNIDGISEEVYTEDNLKITKITINNENAASKIGKPQGEYITIEFPDLSENVKDSTQRTKLISKYIENLIPSQGLILVVGLGNSNITPDALGPKVAKSILATRHITGEIAKTTGLDNLRAVAVMAPGVLGQTGIETSELILSLVKKIKPTAVIVIDALASKDSKHLGSTIQISNSGISPGSGVGNSRPAISKDTIGVPVISIGVPTVVDASTLAFDIVSRTNSNYNDIEQSIQPHGKQMMVTPREIDDLIDHASKLLSMAINCALQPLFSINDLIALTS